MKVFIAASSQYVKNKLSTDIWIVNANEDIVVRGANIILQNVLDLTQTLYNVECVMTPMHKNIDEYKFEEYRGYVQSKDNYSYLFNMVIQVRYC